MQKCKTIPRTKMLNFFFKIFNFLSIMIISNASQFSQNPTRYDNMHFYEFNMHIYNTFNFTNPKIYDIMCVFLTQNFPFDTIF